jgi:hypothetical protein
MQSLLVGSRSGHIVDDLAQLGDAIGPGDDPRSPLAVKNGSKMRAPELRIPRHPVHRGRTTC